MVAGIDITESREARFRRSALLKSFIQYQNGFRTKIANKYSEWIGSFRLLYEEYLNSGYVIEQTPSRIMFNIHHLLPNTVIYIAKSFSIPVSTLTQFFDNPLFGLPSDRIYKAELDILRSEGRVISELGSLATQKEFRWQNLFLHKCRAMFWYSMTREVNDLCIAVNPKHVPYYKTVFLFEVIGVEKYHPGVQAPAVLMRLNLDRLKEKLMAAYSQMEYECNLHDFFYCLEGNPITDYEIALVQMGVTNSDTPPRMDLATAKLLISNTGVLKGLSPDHAAYINNLYPELFY